jgi:hypothetical protein
MWRERDDSPSAGNARLRYIAERFLGLRFQLTRVADQSGMTFQHSKIFARDVVGCGVAFTTMSMAARSVSTTEPAILKDAHGPVYDLAGALVPLWMPPWAASLVEPLAGITSLRGYAEWMRGLLGRAIRPPLLRGR